MAISAATAAQKAEVRAVEAVAAVEVVVGEVVVDEVVVGDVRLSELAYGGIDASRRSRYIEYDTEDTSESTVGVELGSVRNVSLFPLSPSPSHTPVLIPPLSDPAGNTTLNPLANCTVLSPIPPSKCPPGCVSSTPGIAESYFRRGSSRESGISLSGIGEREGKSMERRGTVFGLKVEDLEVSADVLIEECAAA